MNDLGELHYYLGMKFENNKDARTITLNHKNYINKVLEHFNKNKCKHAANFATFL